MMTGKPCSSTKEAASSYEEMAPGVPGTTGTPMLIAVRRKQISKRLRTVREATNQAIGP